MTTPLVHPLFPGTDLFHFLTFSHNVPFFSKHDFIAGRFYSKLTNSCVIFFNFLVFSLGVLQREKQILDQHAYVRAIWQGQGVIKIGWL